MDGTDEIKAQIREQVDSSDVIVRLADRIGAHVKASAVFGDPVARGTTTVIPVAKATFGFGGGSGGDAAQQGSGGGGGGQVKPIGYIEVRDGGATFKPVRDMRMAMLAAGAALGAAALLLRR